MKRGISGRVREGGVLYWSTLVLLAGGSLGLTSCDSPPHTATVRDEQMAALQQKLDAVESQKARLMSGEVANNFELPGVGFYHAAARDFFPYSYGFHKDGKWYVDGAWQDVAPGTPKLTASRPTPEALKKVELALGREQELLNQQKAGSSGSSVTHHHSGFGMGNALMMYWLLAGNRGFFSPGAGFRNAGTQAAGWQQNMDRQRSTVNSYASANPAYRRMVEQSKATGTPVKAGSSVRGGFGGTSSSRSSSSFGG